MKYKVGDRIKIKTWDEIERLSTSIQEDRNGDRILRNEKWADCYLTYLEEILPLDRVLNIDSVSSTRYCCTLENDRQYNFIDDWIVDVIDHLKEIRKELTCG